MFNECANCCSQGVGAINSGVHACTQVATTAKQAIWEPGSGRDTARHPIKIVTQTPSHAA